MLVAHLHFESLPDVFILSQTCFTVMAQSLLNSSQDNDQGAAAPQPITIVVLSLHLNTLHGENKVFCENVLRLFHQEPTFRFLCGTLHLCNLVTLQHQMQTFALRASPHLLWN